MQAILSQYSAAEKTAYLGAIAALATADREASAPEQQFLTSLAESAALSPAATQQVLDTAADATNESIAQHLDVLKDTELKYALIADILSFAKADGKYTADEQAMLEKMATYLGVSTEQVQTLGTVVEKAQQQPTTDPAAMSQMLTSGGLGDLLKRAGIPSGALLSGLLSVLAPMVLSKVMGGQRGSSAGMGDLGGLLGGSATAPAGGGLGALGGLLGSVLGGGQSGGQSGGGLGSLMGVLGGLGGKSGYGGIAQGGLGSVLGGLFGR